MKNYVPDGKKQEGG